MNSLTDLISYVRTNKQGGFAALLNAAAVDLAPTLSFQTRESYLAWVSEWKTAYEHVALELRIAKTKSRLAQAKLPEKVAALQRRILLCDERLASAGECPFLADATVFLGGVRFYANVSQAMRLARYLLALRRASRLAATAAVTRARSG